MGAMRLSTLERGKAFTIEVDGQKIAAYEGETVATALLVAGVKTFHLSSPASRLFCGMGVCMQCLVTINGHPSYRACQTMAQTGMKIETTNDKE